MAHKRRPPRETTYSIETVLMAALAKSGEQKYVEMVRPTLSNISVVQYEDIFSAFHQEYEASAAQAKLHGRPFEMVIAEAQSAPLTNTVGGLIHALSIRGAENTITAPRDGAPQNSRVSFKSVLSRKLQVEQVLKQSNEIILRTEKEGSPEEVRLAACLKRAIDDTLTLERPQGHSR